MKLTIAQRRVLTIARDGDGLVRISGRGYWPLRNGLRRNGLIDEHNFITDGARVALQEGSCNETV